MSRLLWITYGIIKIIIGKNKCVCLAIPGKILKISGQMAEIDFNGIRKEINITMVDVNVGDFVMVHAGFAIEKMEKDNADYINSVIGKK